MERPTESLSPQAAKGSLVSKLPLFGLVALLAYYGAVFLHRNLHEGRAQQTDRKAPVLVVAEGELNLGKVYETPSFRHVLHVTNKNEQPVTITRFEQNCACVNITPGPGVTLAPGETREFVLTLELVLRLDEKGSHSEWPFRVGLAAVCSVDDRFEKAQWDIHCTVIPTVQVKTPVILIGSMSDRQLNFEKVVEVGASHLISQIECSTVSPWSVQANRTGPNRFQVVVRCPGRPMPRRVSDVIQLTPMTDDDKPLPSKEIRIEGEIVTDVVPHPRAVQHGRLPVGTMKEESVTLRSLTDRGFHVKKVTSKSGDIQISKTEDQGSSIYTLRLVANQLGHRELAAQFEIEDQDGSGYVVTIPVRYHGIDSPLREGVTP